MPDFNKTSTELWLALKFVPRLALSKKIQLVDTIGISKLFFNSPSLSAFSLTAAQKIAFTRPDWSRIENIIKTSEQCNSLLIPFDDPEYPQRLKEIADPPLVLFAKGNINLLNNKQLAIVGSRSSTQTGRDIAQAFAQSIAAHGITITSGLALGIDGNAHFGALSELGNTIAVVATGLDSVYPARHKALASDILAAGGCIVSEFPPGTPAKTGHFPKRNRIISGMSLGVLVVEAEMKSGSLITARTALEQNREVFAIPGSILNVNSAGCHWLIKQGAKLVDDCADILDELVDIDHTELHLPKESNTLEHTIVKNEKQDLFLDPLLASVGYEITPIDIVVSRSKLSTREVLTQLTMLELRGLVTAVPGGYLRL